LKPQLCSPLPSPSSDSRTIDDETKNSFGHMRIVFGGDCTNPCSSGECLCHWKREYPIRPWNPVWPVGDHSRRRSGDHSRVPQRLQLVRCPLCGTQRMGFQQLSSGDLSESPTPADLCRPPDPSAGHKLSSSAAAAFASATTSPTALEPSASSTTWRSPTRPAAALGEASDET